MDFPKRTQSSPDSGGPDGVVEAAGIVFQKEIPTHMEEDPLWACEYVIPAEAFSPDTIEVLDEAKSFLRFVLGATDRYVPIGYLLEVLNAPPRGSALENLNIVHWEWSWAVSATEQDEFNRRWDASRGPFRELSRIAQEKPHLRVYVGLDE